MLARLPPPSPFVAIALTMFVAVIVAGGCVSKSPPASPASVGESQRLSDPKAFVLHLIEVARANDVSAWQESLSARLRDRGQEYAARHLKGWGAYLVARESSIRAATCELESSSPRQALVCGTATEPELVVMMVAVEVGELRIDEN